MWWFPYNYFTPWNKSRNGRSFPKTPGNNSRNGRLFIDAN